MVVCTLEAPHAADNSGAHAITTASGFGLCSLANHFAIKLLVRVRQFDLFPMAVRGRAGFTVFELAPCFFIAWWAGLDGCRSSGLSC